METGYFPTARHDGSSWHSTDRSQSCRGALAAKAAVIYIIGDWMENVTTLSFPSWTHNVHPCPMCFCSPDTKHGLKNFTLESVGWELKTIDHYTEECERREIHVVVDGPGHAKIRNSLRIPENGLRAHDTTLPASQHRVCFGVRMSKHGHSTAIHCSTAVSSRPARDDRRCIALFVPGVVQRYCGHMIHQLLDHDVWQVSDAACQVRVEMSVLRLRDQLFGWYSDRERAGRRVFTGWRTSRPACSRTAHAT